MAALIRRLSPQAGFTLAELLVAIAILGLVLAAVLGIYQVTQRSTLIATASEDAQAVARSALEQLLTDLRLINAGRRSQTGAVLAASATDVTFLGDINNDTLDAAGNDATLTAPVLAGATTVQVNSAAGFSAGKLFAIADGAISETQPITGVAGTTVTLGAGLSTSYPAGSIVRSVETVTYTYTLGGPAGTLTRTVGGVTDTLATNVPTLAFTYWDGSTPPVQITNLASQASRDQIREIRVTISAQAQSGDQVVARTMTTTVRPRNLF